MKYSLILIFCFLAKINFGQKVEPIQLEANLNAVEVDLNFNRKYKAALRRLRRVYPMALQAKYFMVEFEKDVENANTRRKKKKLGNKAHSQLKDEFLYSIKDLYTKEGLLLMKLIHRETGMTVQEIIKTYKNGFQSSLYANLGKIWEQDLDAKYDPYGEDWIVELVIKDIIAKRVEFDWETNPLTRSDYKKEKRRTSNVNENAKK